MKVKEQTIKELETLRPDELMIVYDLILSLKGKRTERRGKEHPAAYIRVRNALKDCKGSLMRTSCQTGLDQSRMANGSEPGRN